MQSFLYKICQNRFNMHLFYCFFFSFFFYCLYAKLKSPFSFSLNILASWCQTCAVQAENRPKKLAIRNINISSWRWVLKEGATKFLLLRLDFDLADAPCWMLGSQRGGLGGVVWVLMSKLCHCVLLDSSHWFLFSRAPKVNLSKEHCNCAF